MLFLIYLAATVAVSNGMVMLDGPCQTLSVEATMNWPKFFNNTWYEVIRYPSMNQVHCVDVYAEMKNNTEYTLHLHGVEKGEMVHGHDDIILTQQNIGVFTLGNRMIKVILTDTESYAVLHECTYNMTSNKKMIHNWVFSRDLYLRTKDIGRMAKYFASVNSPELNWDLYEQVLHWGDSCSSSSLTTVFTSLMLTCLIVLRVF